MKRRTNKVIGFAFCYAADTEKFVPATCFRVSRIVLLITIAAACLQPQFALTVLSGVFGVFVLDLIVLLAVRFCRR